MTPINTANHSVATLIIIVEATEISLGIFDNTKRPVKEASVAPNPPGNIAIAPIKVENP